MNLFINNNYLIIALLILSSIISSIFSFAPYHKYWLMPICLVILFFILFNNKLKLKKFQLAYIWGFFYAFAHNYWIKITLNEIIGFNIFISYLLVILFASYLAIYPAIAIWIVDKIKSNNFSKIVILIPAIWTIMEYFRTIIFTGYSFGEIGYCQIDSILSGYVALGGIHLLTYIIILISSLIFYLLFFIRKFLIKIFIICIIILICTLGNYLLKVDFTIGNKNFSTIAAVQGNIPQSLKFSHVDDSVNFYLKQISLYPKVDIMIFPETSIPIIVQGNNDYALNDFRLQSIKNNTSLIMGVILNNKGFLNSAVVINPNNKIFTYYSKNHLVPFGEYRPFYSLLKNFYDKLNIPFSELLKGGSNQKPLVVANQKIAINICYEDGFADELINIAKDSTLLVNISNMGWYGKSNAMDLQLQHSQARALELGRMLIRSTNNGKTAVISNKGKVLSVLPRDVAQILVYEIQGFNGDTPFMKFKGSKILIFLLSLIILFTQIINLFLQNKKLQLEVK